MEFKSVDEILDFAINGEENAYLFYMALPEKVDKKWTSDLFKSFAMEEKGHKEKLLKVKEGNLMVHAEEKVMDMKIADYLEDIELSSDLDYQKALIIAMKAEKQAYRLYTDLANSTDDEGLKQTMLGLAQEEAKHKLRFEIEYDDHVLTEN